MVADPGALVAAFAHRGVLLDTNVLLLLLVGSCDRREIPRHARTSMFTEEDFDRLVGLLKNFDKLVVTPNTLTEASNLLAQDRKHILDVLFRAFRELVISVLDEKYVDSATASADDAFPKVGLTDAGMLALAPGRYLVLTVDFELAGLLTRRGMDVLNFNHLRFY